MCNVQCLEFARRAIVKADIENRDVLEVGSFDYNGSVKRIVDEYGPVSYLGVDITVGPGVDEVVGVERLIERFGTAAFDVVICTEVLEHVLDWRVAIFNMKSVLRDQGVLILTTRSRGFYFHGYPADYWRYELSDMRVIFSDMGLESLESDRTESPGVFVKARRVGPVLTSEDLNGMALYSIIRRRRRLKAGVLDERAAVAISTGKRIGHSILPGSVKRFVRSAVNVASDRSSKG